jgi:hypothetical protein
MIGYLPVYCFNNNVEVLSDHNDGTDGYMLCKTIEEACQLIANFLLANEQLLIDVHATNIKCCNDPKTYSANEFGDMVYNNAINEENLQEICLKYNDCYKKDTSDCDDIYWTWKIIRITI